MAVFLSLMVLLLVSPPRVFSAGAPPKNIALPPPAFTVETKRSDPDRPARASAKIYKGPLIDAHAHIRLPRGENFTKPSSTPF